ncbi:MAG: 4Fe-4S cluster-binding domain-containing protein [Bacteroidales bacterium]|nr:4Fe-4S cluster-binding domain-containing protein [Bacteroidales bacterium]
MTAEDLYNKEEQELLSLCTLCPRGCGVNRFEGGSGYCGADAGMNIASICIHRGEEPQINGPDGICNIFFAGCNMRCIYCQNHDISRPEAASRNPSMMLSNVIDTVVQMLSKGIKSVGFVSPSHVVPQVKAIINGLNSRGLKPVTVYNTNSYDKPETLRSLADLIDVYLPDYKYITPAIAEEYSDASDYPVVALWAMKEMYYQKGSVLHIDNMGRAENGILIRHLVLPGRVEESKKVLKTIAEELSPGIHVSLMSQYHPTPFVRDHPVINRRLYKEEYSAVVRAMEELGFRNGWIQDMDSYRNYRPDFRKEHPFE